MLWVDFGAIDCVVLLCQFDKTIRPRIGWIALRWRSAGPFRKDMVHAEFVPAAVVNFSHFARNAAIGFRWGIVHWYSPPVCGVGLAIQMEMTLKAERK